MIPACAVHVVSCVYTQQRLLLYQAIFVHHLMSAKDFYCWLFQVHTEHSLWMCQEQVNDYSFQGCERTRLGWTENQQHYWRFQKYYLPLVGLIQITPGLLNPAAEVLRSAHVGPEPINHRVPAHQELSGAPVLPHSSRFGSSFLVIC